MESLSRERRQVRFDWGRSVNCVFFYFSFIFYGHWWKSCTGYAEGSFDLIWFFFLFHIWSFTFPEVESGLKIYRAAIHPPWLHSSSLISCGSETLCKWEVNIARPVRLFYVMLVSSRSRSRSRRTLKWVQYKMEEIESSKEATIPWKHIITPATESPVYTRKRQLK